MLVQTRGLCRHYPGVKALDRVNFAMESGEVRALLGRNGAGKSTMIKLLSGIEQPDGGLIELAGQTVSFSGPTDAHLQGIATVHQELVFVHGLTVAENITLGHWPARCGVIKSSNMRNAAKRALDLLGEEIDLGRNMGGLSIAELQLCEIARALSFEPRLLILDEPTSSLPHHEVERVLNVVRRLSHQGVAVIYVSHRMDEISKIADSVTVLRDGKLVSTRPLEESSVDAIAHEMIGGESQMFDPVPLSPPKDEIILSLSNVASGGRVYDVSLEVRAGEVLGIAGLLGSGRTELLKAVAGLAPLENGEIRFSGKKLSGSSPRSRISRGIALVPEERKEEGGLLDFSIAWNSVLSCLQGISRGPGVILFSERDRIAKQTVADLDIITPSIDAQMASLSGGNQQKVVLGRCLNSGVKLLLLDEPTRGVDVHAKAQIYEIIARLAAQGIGIIMVSSEYEELLLTCHRILVLRQGRTDGEFAAETQTMDGLLEIVLSGSQGTGGVNGVMQ